MLTALVDYDAGNLHSAEKAFQRMAREADAGEVVVTGDADVVLRADRVVLPGDGAFPACYAELSHRTGLFEAITENVERKGRPFLGICVGMQLMATRGLEYAETPGLGWIDGDVVKIVPSDSSMKVPHMGWNDLVVDRAHPVLDGISTGDHAYFVHSYQMVVRDSSSLLAHCEYGGPITAIVGRDNMVGAQFHPEKSQAPGLQMIANFLRWTP